MSFEDSFLRKIDRDRRKMPQEAPKDISFELAHKRARELLSHSDYSIQAPSFADLYGQQQVLKDMIAVKESQKTMVFDESTRVSEVFEAIMLEQSELSNWLGENVTVLKSSLYDDYFNGIDMVAEWRESESESNVLALAVDVTYGSRKVEQKLKRERRNIDDGKLAKMKYFRNADGSFRGERSGIPHVIMGISKDRVHEIITKWMKNDNKALAAHPIQKAIIEQIHMQVQVMQEYAHSRGQTKVSDAYKRSLATIEKIRKEKADVSLAGIETDPVHIEIMEQAKRVFRT